MLNMANDEDSYTNWARDRPSVADCLEKFQSLQISPGCIQPG